jgi:unsaturated chondroitin disaccharide hydrolase
MHSVGHKPGKSEMDTPLIWADYYYIEALLRYGQLQKNKKQ